MRDITLYHILTGQRWPEERDMPEMQCKTASNSLRALTSRAPVAGSVRRKCERVINKRGALDS